MTREDQEIESATTEATDIAGVGCAAAAGSEGMPPLTAAQWMFPLGGCDAKLSIVAMPGCAITPEDMDALAEIAALMKKQLQRRAATPQNA